MISPVKQKAIKILTNGSLNLSFTYFLNSKQVLVNEKDNKNFLLNKKQIVYKIQSKEFYQYKKKYLV